MIAKMADGAIFEEDVVFSDTCKGLRYGLVTASAELWSSDSEDDEYDELYEKVKKGTIRVAWHPDGKEDVVSMSQVS